MGAQPIPIQQDRSGARDRYEQAIQRAIRSILKKALRRVCFRSRLRASARAKLVAICSRNSAQLAAGAHSPSRRSNGSGPEPGRRPELPPAARSAISPSNATEVPRRRDRRCRLRRGPADRSIYAMRRDRPPARETTAPGSNSYNSTPPASIRSSARPMLPSAKATRAADFAGGRSGQ